MRETLLALAGRSPAGFTDIRYHRRRGIRLERHGREAGAPIPTEDSGGLVRCTSPGAGWGIASFRDPGEAGAAVALAHELSLLAPAAAAGQLTEVPARDGEFPCPAQRDPAQVSMAAKEDLLALAAAALHDADRRIVASRLVYQDLLEDTWLVTSEGTSLAESRPRMELSALAIAEEEGTRERALDSIAVAGAWFDLEEWIGRIGHLAEKAVLLLRAVPVRPGRVPVVLDPLAAGLLAHRCAGHLCHGDRDEDQGPAPVGLRVGPPLLTIGDDGTVPGLHGTMAFDHEGISPRNTALIQNGVVVAHLHTRVSADLAGVAPTGNARGSLLAAPRARMTNTYVARGKDSLDELLRDIPLGLYLADPVSVRMSGSEAGLGAGHARVIRNGVLAEPVRGAVLAGDPLALFGLVDRVGNDFRWNRDASRCRRGGGEAVPVSTGAPHLRLVEAPVGEPA